MSKHFSNGIKRQFKANCKAWSHDQRAYIWTFKAKSMMIFEQNLLNIYYRTTPNFITELYRTLHKTKNNFMTMDLHPRSFPLIRLSPHFQALQIPRWNKKTYCNIPHWQGMILYYLVRLEQFLTLKKKETNFTHYLDSSLIHF